MKRICRHTSFLATMILMGWAWPASAQPEPVAPSSVARNSDKAPSPRPIPRRGYVLLGGGYLLNDNSFDDGAVKRINAEDGRFDSNYAVKGGLSLDAAIGVRVWKSLGLRAGIDRRSTPTATTVKASLPHPFFFGRPRSVSGGASDLSREELALALHVAGLFPIGRRMQVTVFAGPTWFQVKQGVVTDFTYTDTYPYDTATFGRALTSNNSASRVGIGGGAGLNLFLTQVVGVSATAQLSQAEVSLSGAGGETAAVRAGGVKAGLAIVFRY